MFYIEINHFKSKSKHTKKFNSKHSGRALQVKHEALLILSEGTSFKVANLRFISSKDGSIMQF